MTGSPASEHPDRGASAERTRLAWRRTALAGTVVALLAARPAVAPQAGARAFLLAAAGILGCGSVILGSAESAARLFADIVVRKGTGDPEAAARAALAELRTATVAHAPLMTHPVESSAGPTEER